MTSKKPELLSLAKEAALKAGSLLKQGFGTTFEISSKEGHHNLVTTYDKLAEKTIHAMITERFPSHGFLGEESGHQKQGDIHWIVDPLDGTVNFAHNVPVFCVSIAAVQNNQVLVGAVYQPMTDELFYAEKGHGAFLNEKKLQVSSETLLERAYLATGFPYNVSEDPHHCIETFDQMTRQGIPIRRLGSAAIDLAYVAAGRFDGYWEVTLQPWDLAAGHLLVQEAGGKVTQYDGTPCNLTQAGSVLATNHHLHSAIQKVVL